MDMASALPAGQFSRYLSEGFITARDFPITGKESNIVSFITTRRGDPCLQAEEETPPPFEFPLNRFVSFPADAASCS